MSRMEGKRVLITGASSGIGAATAQLLIAEGASVALLDRQKPLWRSQAVQAYEADVTDEISAGTAVTAAAEHMGGLDALINCAGISAIAPAEDTSIEIWRRIIDVNLTGTFIVCKAAIPFLRKAGSGTIVTVASASGLLPSSAGAAYGASKAGVDMLMKYLSRELAPTIRVNAVCPGMVATPMVAEATRDVDPAVAEQAVRNTYALQRMAAPAEIAEALLWLSSPASSYVTGISLAVDGGRTFH